jgi:hypothetical protein
MPSNSLTEWQARGFGVIDDRISGRLEQVKCRQPFSPTSPFPAAASSVGDLLRRESPDRGPSSSRCLHSFSKLLTLVRRSRLRREVSATVGRPAHSRALSVRAHSGPFPNNSSKAGGISIGKTRRKSPAPRRADRSINIGAIEPVALG